MTDVRLEPPFDPLQLQLIVKETREAYHEDLGHTAAWLLTMNDGLRMVDAVRRAWRASSLPLRTWGDLITRVFAYTTDQENSIWLEIVLKGWEEHDVLQQAPFTHTMLETCRWMLPCPIPQVMCDVALSAPGLRLKDEAMIGAPQAYVDPMGFVRHWMRDVPLILNDTKEELPLDFFITEVATDPESNQIVLGSDERLYYWAHEVGVMFRCKVDLEKLIAEFFRNPASLSDYEFLGVRWEE